MPCNWRAGTEPIIIQVDNKHNIIEKLLSNFYKQIVDYEKK